MGSKTAYRDTTAARHAFRRAVAPGVDAISGDWEIEYVGGEIVGRLRPWRERILGLSKLFGLRFESTAAHHLLGRPKRGLEQAKPLAVQLGPSELDGEPAVLCLPAPELGGAWSLFRLEVRALDDDELIALDVVGPRGWSIPMPFLLHRHDG